MILFVGSKVSYQYVAIKTDLEHSIVTVAYDRPYA